ncbi:MAG TPA: VOC family protein [Gammaproteobacteria bacterium]|nr:VOC family protein [Gammaproteobacteria bacterium]
MAITAYLLYRDARAAVDWLVKAFGLQADEVLRGEGGRVDHASLSLGKSLLMLGSPGPDFKGPRASGHSTANVYVDVEDVEAHYARAVAAGATIVEEPKDTFYGARRYGAEDLEGHRWYFAQDLSPTPRRAGKSRRRKPAARSKKTTAQGRKRASRK